MRGDDIPDEVVRDDVPTRGLPVAAPAHMLPVQVIRRKVLGSDVVSVFIVLPGTQQAPAPYLPGQFVTLALPTPRETLYRSYSLCGDGDAGHPWELTIKRMEMGAVSTFFYKSVQEGTLLYASLPRGTFTLPQDVGPESVLMMVAMGSGITPIMGMLRAIANMPPRERPLVQLHYASRSPDEIIFGDELEEMDPQETWLQQRHYLSSRRQRMSVDAIVSHAGSMGRRADWYVCGADSFKRELHERLTRLRVPERRIHSEVFAAQPGPAYRLGASPATGGSIAIAETGASLDVEPNETLLTALERHGYRPNFSCRVGACGSCKLRLLGGEVDQVGEALSAAERDDGYVLSCIAHPIGDVTLASGGRPPAGVRRVTVVAGAVSGPTAGGTALTRVAAVVGVGALLLGTWNLTDHRPQSWDVIASPTPQATAADPNATALPSPSATTAGGSGPVRKPTATPTHAASTGGAPAPTPTKAAPAPTATPKPTPVCHSTPSKPC